MSHTQTPHILLLMPRVPNWLGPVFEKSFEKNDWIVTASFDTDPAAVAAILDQQKFDAMFYVCPEVWEEGRGGKIGENAWSILEKKTKTQNADIPTIAYTISPADEDIARLRVLGVTRVFQAWNGMEMKQLLQAVREAIASNAVPALR